MSKMMRFLDKFSHSFLKQRHFRRLILRVSLYSTQTQLSSSPTLYQGLKRCHEQRVSLIPVLDKWVIENGQIHDQELKKFITNFRKSRRFKPALEIAEWMSHSMEHLANAPRHVAVQLDLISKVHGLERAENYFYSLKGSLIDLPVYSALLNCYAEAKSLEKAEATMEKIRKLKYPSILAYNTMLSLYSQTGMHEKFEALIQEMEDKGIDFNEVTYNIRLNAYANSDLERMEKLLLKMEVDPLVTADFYSYVTAAKGYIKAGNLEKASVVLKKAEHLIKGQQRLNAYGSLITFYTTLQKKEDVYRLWNMIRNDGRLKYWSYVYIFTSLEKFDDLDGARKILEEWLEKNTDFDIRIPNLVISAHCKKGLLGEAEIILKRLIETGKEPSARTWSHMAHGYYETGQMEKAVEMIKKAIPATFPGWKPDLTILAACLEYLKNKGDVDGTQEILMLLQKCGSFSEGFKERVGRYLSNGKPGPDAPESRDSYQVRDACDDPS